MIASLWVMLGGAFGSVGRFWLGLVVARLTGPTFPWGTLLINVLGSFVIGLFAKLTMPAGPLAAVPDIRILAMVGICGGFTTFSSFSLQTVELIQARQIARASAYVISSVVLCLIGTWLGMQL